MSRLDNTVDYVVYMTYVIWLAIVTMALVGALFGVTWLMVVGLMFTPWIPPILEDNAISFYEGRVVAWRVHR